MELHCNKNLTIGEAITPCGGKLRHTSKLENKYGQDVSNDTTLRCEECGAFWDLSLIEGVQEVK